MFLLRKIKLNIQKYNQLFLSILFLSLISCSSKERTEKTVNIDANAQHNSCYQWADDFPNSQVYVNDIAKYSDEQNKNIQFEANGCSQIAVCMNDGSVIMGTNDGKILKVQDKKILKYYQIQDSMSPISPLVADQKSNIYFLDFKQNLYSISDSLKLNWKISLPVAREYTLYTSPVLSESNHGKQAIYIGSNDGNLFKYNQNGKLEWSYSTSLQIMNMPAISKSGDLICSISNNEYGKTDSILVFAANGKVKKSLFFPNMRIMKSAICSEIDGKNYIYVSATSDINNNKLTRLFKFDENLNPVWQKEYSFIIRNISVADNGEVYFVGFNSGVGENKSVIISLDEKGNKRWNLYYDYSIPYPIMIGEKSVVFTGSNQVTAGLFYMSRSDGNLYSTINLGEHPDLWFRPVCDYYGRINLFSRQNPYYITVDKTMIEKMIFW